MGGMSSEEESNSPKQSPSVTSNADVFGAILEMKSSSVDSRLFDALEESPTKKIVTTSGTRPARRSGGLFSPTKKLPPTEIGVKASNSPKTPRRLSPYIKESKIALSARRRIRTPKKRKQK